MSNTNLYAAWAAMFGICAALGFVPSPTGAAYGAMFCLGLLFFIPPAVLLYQAGKRGDRMTLKTVRNLSLASLIATPVMLILNFVSVAESRIVGRIVYWLLIIVSTPMVCSQVWIVSLFCWACLLMVSLRLLRKNR